MYGVLHEFLRRRVIISAGLGKHACDINEQSMAKSNAAYICYDDGCHLRKLCRNPVRRELSDTSKCLASIPIMVDKMHIAGHVDAWCLENCDSRNVTELNKVNRSYMYPCMYLLCIHT